MGDRDMRYWNARHRNWWEGKPRWLVIVLSIAAFIPLIALGIVVFAAILAAGVKW